MFVCICKALDEKGLKELHRKGVDTLSKVIQHCGAGGDCGTCAFKINRILKEESSLPIVEEDVAKKVSNASGE